MKIGKFRMAAPILFMVLFTYAHSGSDLSFRNTNLGIGMGTRWIDFDLKFNGMNQKYSTGNSAGLSLYLQKILTQKYGLDFTIYQEWNGHRKLMGVNDSDMMEVGTYSSEGSSGLIRVGVYREFAGVVQFGMNVGVCGLGLHPSDIIANDFNGASLGLIPTLKVSFPNKSKHGCSFIVYGGAAILGNFTGKMVGGALNYEIRLR